jgi:hypothetical protein
MVGIAASVALFHLVMPGASTSIGDIDALEVDESIEDFTFSDRLRSYLRRLYGEGGINCSR